MKYEKQRQKVKYVKEALLNIAGEVCKRMCRSTDFPENEQLFEKQRGIPERTALLLGYMQSRLLGTGHQACTSQIGTNLYVYIYICMYKNTDVHTCLFQTQALDTQI